MSSVVHPARGELHRYWKFWGDNLATTPKWSDNFLPLWHPRLLVWERPHTELSGDEWPDLTEFRQDLSLTRQQLL